MTGFNLSDKVFEDDFHNCFVIRQEDVKEFIKLLKEIPWEQRDDETINKLAGDKLI